MRDYKTVSLSDQVFERLEDDILSGKYERGEIITELQLCAELGVSRTPVREAMQLLADQKLIEIQPGKESRVATFDYDEIEKSYIMLAELHALALQFAWESLTEEDIREMEGVNEAMKNRRNAADLHRSQTLDKEFHDVVVKKAGNDFLKNFTDILDIQVLRIENLYFEEESNYEESWKAHERILQGIRDKDLQAACAAMRENWMRTISLVQRLKEGEHA